MGPWPTGGLRTDKHVVVGEVPGDGIHDEHNQVAAAVQEQCRGQVRNLPSARHTS